MPLFYSHPLLRTTLYALTWMSAVALLGLTASRLQTTHDFLNSIEPIVAELLATSILAILWIPVEVFHVLRHVSLRTELIPLSILWLMYLVGAAIATNHWPTLTICNLETFGCNILIPMIAMAWLGFSFITLIIFLVLLNFATGYGARTRTTTRAPRAHTHHHHHHHTRQRGGVQTRQRAVV